MLSIVIPVYNEQETLAYTLERLLAVDFGRRTELVFVNDGSQDHSYEILRGFLKNPTKAGFQIRVVEFSRNFGHSAAVLAGLTHATGDLLAIIDADLQDPPEVIPQMIAQLEAEDLDVVYGLRSERQGETLLKRATAWLFYRGLNLLSGIEIPKDTGDFRVVRRNVCQAVLASGEQEPFLRGLVAWVGFRQGFHPYVRTGRKFGSTKYPFKKMVRFAGLAVISFSEKPLRLGLYVGALGFLIALGLTLSVLHSWWQGRTVTGWPSLVLVMVFFHSLTLFLLGLHGMYLGRIYKESQSRPRFIVRSNTSSV